MIFDYLHLPVLSSSASPGAGRSLVYHPAGAVLLFTPRMATIADRRAHHSVWRGFHVLAPRGHRRGLGAP
jgi:hypothetical protein